mgnify:CR=1 FL=1
MCDDVYNAMTHRSKVVLMMAQDMLILQRRDTHKDIKKIIYQTKQNQPGVEHHIVVFLILHWPAH